MSCVDVVECLDEGKSARMLSQLLQEGIPSRRKVKKEQSEPGQIHAVLESTARSEVLCLCAQCVWGGGGGGGHTWAWGGRKTSLQRALALCRPLTAVTGEPCPMVGEKVCPKGEQKRLNGH